MRDIKKIIVHHTADVSNAPQFDKVNEYHKTLGFPRSLLGYYCGYHVLIERSGEIRVARFFEEIGAHDKGENMDSIGVGLAGNFDGKKPSLEQGHALGSLLAMLTAHYGLPDGAIEPHRIGDNTSCYGKMLSDAWAREITAAFRSGFFGNNNFSKI